MEEGKAALQGDRVDAGVCERPAGGEELVLPSRRGRDARLVEGLLAVEERHGLADVGVPVWTPSTTGSESVLGSVTPSSSAASAVNPLVGRLELVEDSLEHLCLRFGLGRHRPVGQVLGGRREQRRPKSCLQVSLSC